MMAEGPDHEQRATIAAHLQAHPDSDQAVADAFGCSVALVERVRCEMTGTALGDESPDGAWLGITTRLAPERPAHG
jgi:hypothetical protein